MGGEVCGPAAAGFDSAGIIASLRPEQTTSGDIRRHLTQGTGKLPWNCGDGLGKKLQGESPNLLVNRFFLLAQLWAAGQLLASAK